MIGAIEGGLALLVMMGEARARGPRPAPRLQVTHLAGELRIEPAQKRGGGSESRLPDIPSGSTVEVVSGTAVFGSDYHAVIRAKKGARFQFTASHPDEGRPGSLRIGLAGGDPEALEVMVGGEKFLLPQDGAAVSIAPEGSAAVRVAAAGQVQLVIASDSADEENIEFGPFPRNGVSIPPGTWVRVGVRDRKGFKSAPVSLASWRISRENAAATLVAGDDQKGSVPAAPEAVREAVQGWPKFSREVAGMVMEKYGPPGKISDGELAWNNNGPWNRTIVRRFGRFQNFRKNRWGVLQQFVRYEIPRGMIAPLARLNGGLQWDGDSRELSATGDSEEANFLALNIANDFAAGRLSVEEARELFTRTMENSREGKSSAYMEKLSFEQY